MTYSTVNIGELAPDAIEAITAAVKKGSSVISNVQEVAQLPIDELMSAQWNEVEVVDTSIQADALSTAEGVVAEKKTALDALKGEQAALVAAVKNAGSELSVAKGAKESAQRIADTEAAKEEEDQDDLAGKEATSKTAQGNFVDASEALDDAKQAQKAGETAVEKSDLAHKAAIKQAAAAKKTLADAQPAKTPKEINWEIVKTLADKLTNSSSGLVEEQTGKGKKVNEMLTAEIEKSQAILAEYITEKSKINSSWEKSDAAKHFAQVKTLEDEITALKTEVEGKDGVAQVELDQKIGMKEKEVDALKGTGAFLNMYGYFPGSTPYKTSSHEKQKATHEADYKVFEEAYKLAEDRVSGLTDIANILGALDEVRFDSDLCKELKACTTKGGSTAEARNECYAKVQKLIAAIGKATDLVKDSDGKKVEATADAQWLSTQLDSSLANFAKKHEKPSGICSFG